MHTALICLLIAGLLPYAWGSLSKVAGTRYDNADVRGWQSRLTGLPQRAYAAHLNSFEAFPLFAAAVIAALLTGANLERLAQLSIAYVCLRVLYGLVYLANLASIRSLVWFAALICNIVIFASAISAVTPT